MNRKGLISQILDNWRDEFKLSVADNPSIYIALFDTQGELIFANKTLKSFFVPDIPPKDNFLKPLSQTAAADDSQRDTYLQRICDYRWL